jgi:hypothetical protein
MTYRNWLARVCALILLSNPLAGFEAYAKGDCCPTSSRTPAKSAKPYPMTTCLVCEKDLAQARPRPRVTVHKGQQVKLCAKPCLATFQRDPARYLAGLGSK